MKSILPFLLLPIFLLVSCSAADDTFEKNIRTFDKKPGNYPDALIQLNNGTGVKYYELGGSLQMTYKILADYPATEVIETISNHLEKSKWYPMKEDFMNPGRQIEAPEWTTFEDETNKPTQTVHQQILHWENQIGEVVIYWFFYRYESGKTKDLKNLTVTGVFCSAPLVQKTREWALEFHKKNNGEKFK
jgi:hypothetical protein